jgi:hypothetical protein
VALRLWHSKARLEWLAEWGAAAVQLQRWARGCVLRRRRTREAIAKKQAQVRGVLPQALRCRRACGSVGTAELLIGEYHTWRRVGGSWDTPYTPLDYSPLLP